MDSRCRGKEALGKFRSPSAHSNPPIACFVLLRRTRIRRAPPVLQVTGDQPSYRLSFLCTCCFKVKFEFKCRRRSELDRHPHHEPFSKFSSAPAGRKLRCGSFSAICFMAGQNSGAEVFLILAAGALDGPPQPWREETSFPLPWHPSHPPKALLSKLSNRF